MITYKRTPSKNNQGEEIFKYFKDGNPTKESTVPHEVIEKFDIINPVEYDEEPERRRCLFCDAPQKRIRILNLTTIDMCEWHYLNLSLGKIAQAIRELDKTTKRNEQIQARKIEKKKAKRKRKTALSKIIS